jgi:hypothetical protein
VRRLICGGFVLQNHEARLGGPEGLKGNAEWCRTQAEGVLCFARVSCADRLWQALK